MATKAKSSMIAAIVEESRPPAPGETKANHPALVAVEPEAPPVTIAQPPERLPAMIYLSKLRVADGNVRRGTKGDLEQLAADIAAHGLLQNLTGVKQDDGTVTIIAGGRRLRAMQALVKRKAWDADTMVPVLLIEDGVTAREAGLAENFQRLPMAAVDEVRAFAEAVQGGDVAGVAVRFGVTERHVRQRLRLAQLAPAVIEALGTGKISLDVAQAFASVPDQARQAKVLKEAGSYDLTRAESIRRFMQRVGYAADDPKAKFVGREAYVEAGGSFAVDLFSEADDEHWLDEAVLDRLAGEKLRDACADLRLKWKFDRVIPVMMHNDADDLTEGLEIAGRWTDFTQRPEADRVRMVVMGEIGGDGAAKVRASMAWWASGSALAPAREAPPPSAVRDENVQDSEVIGGGAPQGEAEQDVVAEKDLSQRLIDALAMQRRDVLALELLSDEPVAIAVARDLAAFWLVEAIGRRFLDWGICSSIQTNDLNDPARPNAEGLLPWSGEELAAALGDARGGGDAPLDVDWRSLSTPAERFVAFSQLPLDDKARWLARGVAATMRAVPLPAARAAKHCIEARAMADAIADRLGRVVPHESWRPTAANYFDRCGKAGCEAFLLECTGANDFPGLDGWMKLKKADLAALCELLAAGNSGPLMAALGVGDRDHLLKRVLGRFATWVPVEMRFPGGEA